MNVSIAFLQGLETRFPLPGNINGLQELVGELVGRQLEPLL